MSQRTVPPNPLDVQRSYDTLEAPLSPLLLFATSLAVVRVMGPWCLSALLSFARVVFARMLSSPQVPHALPWSTLLPVALFGLALVLAASLTTLIQTRAALHRGRGPRRGAPEGLGGVAAVILLGAGFLACLHLVALDRPLSGLRGSFDALLSVVFGVGVLDHAVRWVRWRAALHLTPEEARRRAREDSGDPALRRHRRDLHRSTLSEPAPER